MRIFRILNKQEYSCFLNRQSLFNPEQEEYKPAGMLFPENIDRFGKFFFFEIEDIYNFVYNYSNAKPSDMILELDIDRETALKYLSVADYVYFDPTKSGKNFTREQIESMGHMGRFLYTYNHAIPELYIDNSLINEKIQSGEYKIFSPETLLAYESRPASYYEADRNPKTLELARRLKKVRRLRQKIRDLDAAIYYAQLEKLSAPEKRNKKEKSDEEKLKELNAKLAATIEDTKAYFIEFAREHEKYMELVPIPDESQPE